MLTQNLVHFEKLLVENLKQMQQPGSLNKKVRFFYTFSIEKSKVKLKKKRRYL